MALDEAEAEAILLATVSAAADRFGSELDAVFALGSLAHGGFDPLVSDVDVALVLNRHRDDVAPTIADVKDAVMRALPGPLSTRLSMFWSDWRGVRDGPAPDERLPAVDRLDLLDSGRLLHGRDLRSGATRPSPELLIREAAEFACDRFDADYLHRLRSPAQLVADGPRTATKAVLFPVRFLYTLATREIGLNSAAVAWYREHGEHRELTDAASRWREHGITDPEAAVTLLDAHLRGIYREFCGAYRQALVGSAPDLADRLSVLIDSL